MLMHCLIVLSALGLSSLGASSQSIERDNPDDIVLGDETRQRKLDQASVAGRQLLLYDGASYSLLKSGAAVHSGPGRKPKQGDWSIASGNVLKIKYDNGDEDHIIFVTLRGELYLRYVFQIDSRAQFGGDLRGNIRQREPLRIRSIKEIK